MILDAEAPETIIVPGVVAQKTADDITVDGNDPVHHHPEEELVHQLHRHIGANIETILLHVDRGHHTENVHVQLATIGAIHPRENVQMSQMAKNRWDAASITTKKDIV